MKRLMMVFMLFCFCCYGFAQTAAKSYYVRADGNDENLGLSETEPLKTLSKAIERANAGSIKKITVIGILYQKDEPGIWSSYSGTFWIETGGKAEILITGKANASQEEKAVLSGKDAERGSAIVEIYNSNIRFEHIEITGGDKHGGIRVLQVGFSPQNISSNVVLGPGCIIHGNTDSYGGGVYIDNCNKVVLDGGSIIKNTAEEGGGVYICDAYKYFLITVPAGEFVILNGEISENKADYGAGVYVKGKFHISGGSIRNNSARYTGGGLYISNTGNATQNNDAASGIVNNLANEDGEDIFAEE